MHFGAPWALYLLLLLPFLVVWLRRAWRRRVADSHQFAEGTLFQRLVPGLNRQRQQTKLQLVVLGLAFLIFALSRPQYGEQREDIKRTGLDILVAIDTSKSMLAEDIRPNRLSAAKREVKELISRLEGDRIGLIAFAGTAVTLCPLTLDYGATEIFLQDIDTNTVSVPGTNVAEAIKRANLAFSAEEQKYKVLVLITDGESTTGDDPVAAAKAAGDQGVRIFTIGVGGTSGNPIPLRDENGNLTQYEKTKQGEVVQSKLDVDTLTKIAEAAGGSFYQASWTLDELDQIYDQVREMESKELQSQMYIRHTERFQIPLAIGLLLLLLEYFLPERTGREESKG